MLKEILEIFDRLKESWCEWKSLPVVGFTEIAAFIWLVLTFEELRSLVVCLYLAFAFIGLFAAYAFMCAFHVLCEKEKKAIEAADVGSVPKKTKKKALLIMGVCVSLLLCAISICRIVFGFFDRDGHYVIWADEYHVALTDRIPQEDNKQFYLAGTQIVTRGGKVEDYTNSCVFELDFKGGDTFTISSGGKLFGTTPDEKVGGVGCNDNQTSNLWKLEEADDGVYYIINVGTDKYLQWLSPAENWTCREFSEKYEEQFRMCIEKLD
ncbi:MAG: RICIN domain-containing protein [Clostridia bacterium]|nr:RICIN domain-containing protein [Clostridia bacterium]